MSYQSRRMNSILTLSIILFVNSPSILARMCYVCGAGSQEPFMQTSKTKLEYSDMDVPLSCDEFESSDNLDKFIFTCPSNYVGCITQSDGTDVTRTCDSLSINDCQTANGVEYCYCTDDLCNKRKLIPIRTHHHETFYDDEDASDLNSFEASGYDSSDTNSDGTMETTITTATSSSSSSSSPTIRNIKMLSSDVTVTTTITTVTTTTEAITSNKIFTTGYNQSHTITTITSSTAESTNTNASSFVKCSKVIFIMQLLMVIFPLCC